MLKSYEAVYENGRVTWLNDRPTVEPVRIIVTVLEETESSEKNQIRRCFPAAAIASKGKTLGDIVSPIVDEEDWECLK